MGETVLPCRGDDRSMFVEGQTCDEASQPILSQVSAAYGREAHVWGGPAGNLSWMF